MVGTEQALVREDDVVEPLDPETDKIILNVGGIRHETVVSTLTNDPDTRLGQLALQHRDFGAHEYFFDRNPEVFNCVIDYYRSGQLHIPTGVCSVIVKRELEYWCLKDSLIQPCCWSQYCKNVGRQEALASINKIPMKEQLEIEQLKLLKGLPKLRMAIWIAMKRPNLNRISTVYSAISSIFITVAVLEMCLESLPQLQNRPDTEEYRNKCGWSNDTDVNKVTQLFPDPVIGLRIVDFVCNGFFTVEFVIRLSCTPKWRSAINRITLIDFLSVVPFYMMLGIREFYGGLCDHDKRKFILPFMYTLRILRVARIFQVLVFFKPLKILWKSILESWHELVTLLACVAMFVVIFATIIFYAELYVLGDSSKFNTIPMGLWWAIITITTVGYGDLFPDTAAGYVVGGACAIAGTLVMALTIPILSSNFEMYYTHARTFNQATTKEQSRQRELKKQGISQGLQRPNSMIDDGSVMVPTPRGRLESLAALISRNTIVLDHDAPSSRNSRQSSVRGSGRDSDEASLMRVVFKSREGSIAEERRRTPISMTHYDYMNTPGIKRKEIKLKKDTKKREQEEQESIEMVTLPDSARGPAESMSTVRETEPGKKITTEIPSPTRDELFSKTPPPPPYEPVKIVSSPRPAQLHSKEDTSLSASATSIPKK